MKNVIPGCLQFHKKYNKNGVQDRPANDHSLKALKKLNFVVSKIVLLKYFQNHTMWISDHISSTQNTP